MRYLLALLVVLALALPAQGHPEAELETWYQGWHQQVQEKGALTPRAISQLIDMRERHPCSQALDTPCLVVVAAVQSLTSQSIRSTFIPQVEAWRSLVETYFGANTNAALSVMQCESLGNPNAKNSRSSASGLFQFLESTWHTVTGEVDHNGVFDGAYNIMAAAELSKGGTNWGQWSCKP